MIDQSHNIEDKIEAMILSLINCQVAYAKALIVDRKALAAKQQAGRRLGRAPGPAGRLQTDVRPLLQQVRIEMGLRARPDRRLPRQRLP